MCDTLLKSYPTGPSGELLEKVAEIASMLVFYLLLLPEISMLRELASVCMYVRMCLHVCVCAHVYARVSMCVCVYLCMHMCCVGLHAHLCVPLR